MKAEVWIIREKATGKLWKTHKGKYQWGSKHAASLALTNANDIHLWYNTTYKKVDKESLDFICLFSEEL